MDCPSLAELERYSVSDEGASEVREHIATCAVCRAALQGMRDNNELFEEILGADRGRLSAELGYARSDAAEGYRILEELHRGGQGIVYRAVQESTKREVAVKVLLEGTLASSERRRRFEREIELVAALRHPGIVTVFDSGVMDDGRHFFAMEYIQGLTLDAALRRGEDGGGSGAGGAPEEALRLFVRICEAVQYAHQRGVIHRDLKPANILVDPDRNPHVLDFGLAKAIDPELQTGPALTASQEFMGTLAYASPEQLEGDPLAVDLRTDVYSLGVILYEIVAGRSPYPDRSSVVDLVRAIAEDEPPPPSAAARSSRARRTSVGSAGELDTIVLKAMAKDKERRYPSVGDLGRDVQRLLAGDAIDARRDSTWYVLRKAVRRHKLPFALTAGLVVLSVGSAIGLGALWRRSLQAAERERLEARDAGQVSGFLVDLFADSDPALTGGREVLARDLLDAGVKRIDADLGEQPELQVRLLRRMGQSYSNLGLYPQAIPLLERAHELALDHHGERHLDTARVQAQLGRAYRHAGAGDALDLLERCVRTHVELLGPSDAEALEARLELASVFIATDALPDAVAIYADVERALGALEGERRELRASLLANWAHASFLQRDMERAAARAREALEIHREFHPEPHPAQVMSLNTLSIALRNLGRLEECESTYTELLDQCRRLYGEETDRYAIVLRNRARLLEDLDREEEALEGYRAALSIFDKTLAPEHPQAVSCLHKLASLLHRGGHHAEAREMLRRDLAVLLPTVGELHSRAVFSREALGISLAALGEWEGAERELREALAVRERAGSRTGYLLRTRAHLGEVLARRGRCVEARAMLEPVLAAARAEASLGRLATQASLGLARVADAEGRPDEAVRHLREALAVEPGDSEHWARAAAESELGARPGTAAAAERESLLRSGARALRRSLGPEHVEARAGLERLVAFLEAEGRSDEVLDARRELAFPATGGTR